MIRINIWSDFACPWCYIGEKRLEDAITKLGMNGDIDIYYHAFELDPKATKEGKLTSAERIANKYNLPLERAKNKVAQIDNVGKELGLKFNYTGAIPTNTFDAHRLMKLAEQSYSNDIVQKVNDGLFEAYFVRNLVISDPEVLTEIGVNAGIEKSDITNMLNSDQYKEDVINDENEAHALGITGVPYIVIEDKLAIPGAVSTEDFMNAIIHVNNTQIAGKGVACETPNP